MSKLIKEANIQLASWSVLYTKLHHFHWYVTGPHFFTLHEKFEELYNEAATTVDTIAERILAIKGEPLSTMASFLEASKIEEAEKNMSAFDMVRGLEQDLQTLSSHMGSVIKAAETMSDNATADLFIGLKESVDKHGWMLRAFADSDKLANV